MSDDKTIRAFDLECWKDEETGDWTGRGHLIDGTWASVTVSTRTGNSHTWAVRVEMKHKHGAGSVALAIETFGAYRDDAIREARRLMVLYSGRER